MTEKQYEQLVQEMAPKSPTIRDCCNAFWIGGLICAIGQFFLNCYSAWGLDKDAAGTATSITLVALSALLTGLSLYDNIAKHAGAGTLVPITGFANAIAAPAIEFKTDECAIIGPSRKAFISGEYDDLVQKSISEKAVHTYNVGGIRNCSSQFDNNNFLPATQVMIPNGFCHTVRYFFEINNERNRKMEIGALVYQKDTDRMDIRFSPNRYYGGLRCGDTFDVRINRKWIPTRIELGRAWFLVGIKTDDLVGLVVRI